MYFQNPRMISQLTHSQAPGILNSVSDGSNNYNSYDIKVLGTQYMSELDKQTSFNNQINSLLFGGSKNTTAVENVINNQQSRVMNSLQNTRESVAIQQKQNNVQQVAKKLEQTAEVSNINDLSDSPIVETFGEYDNSSAPQIIQSSPKSNNSTFVVIICIFAAFVLYLMIQIYVSQKKVEMLIEINQNQFRNNRQ